MPTQYSASGFNARTILKRRSSKPAEEYKEITVRGRMVCLDASGNQFAGQRHCDLHKERSGFVTGEGKLFTFWHEDSTGGMRTDPRVSKDQLQLTARLRVNDQLETIRIQAVRDGKLYDVYYFCDVCNITAYAPGPCPCCYQELEFIERPATDR
jgi:rubrerythrin